MRVVAHTSGITYEPMSISGNIMSVNQSGSQSAKGSLGPLSFRETSLWRETLRLPEKGLSSPLVWEARRVLSSYVLCRGLCIYSLPLIHNVISGTHLWDILYLKYISSLSINILWCEISKPGFFSYETTQWSMRIFQIILSLLIFGNECLLIKAGSLLRAHIQEISSFKRFYNFILSFNIFHWEWLAQKQEH